MVPGKSAEAKTRPRGILANETRFGEGVSVSEGIPWDGEIRAFRTVRGHDPILLRVSAQETLVLASSLGSVREELPGVRRGSRAGVGCAWGRGRGVAGVPGRSSVWVHFETESC